MGQMFRCVFLVLALCFFAPSALAEPLESGGIWTAFGDVDAPVKTCSIQGAVNDGIFKLSTASDHQNVLHLQLSKVAWDIPNRAVPVTFTFPNGGLFTFIGRGQGSAMDFDVPLSDMRSFIHQFTAEPTGTLYFPEGREKPWLLPLSGSTPTITAMGKCMDTAGIVLQPFAAQSTPTAQTGSPSQPAAIGNAAAPADGVTSPTTETQAPVQATPPAPPAEAHQDTTYSEPQVTRSAPPSRDSYDGVIGAIGIGLVAVGVAAIALYFVPTIVGSSRKIENTGLLFLVNLVFGWTLIGWFGCLLWAALAQDGTQRLLHRRMLANRNEF